MLEAGALDAVGDHDQVLEEGGLGGRQSRVGLVDPSEGRAAEVVRLPGLVGSLVVVLGSLCEAEDTDHVESLDGLVGLGRSLESLHDRGNEGLGHHSVSNLDFDCVRVLDRTACRCGGCRLHLVVGNWAWEAAVMALLHQVPLSGLLNWQVLQAALGPSLAVEVRGLEVPQGCEHWQARHRGQR